MKHSRLITLLLVLAVAVVLPVTVYGQEATPPPSQPEVKSDSGATKETPPPAPKTARKGHTAKKAAEAKAPKIDINSAPKEELMKLTGIGDVTADKIIAGRPYKSKGELVTKKVLTKKEYAKVRSLIIAKQEAPAEK